MKLPGRRERTSDAAASLRPLLYGDRSLEEWPSAPSGGAEPLASFAQARERVLAGRTDEAIAIWHRIAETPGAESRHVLQAWHLLRGLGVGPEPGLSSMVMASVAEVAVPAGHDLLIGYRDRSVRYLNWTGKVAISEPDAAPAIESAAAAWLEFSGLLAPQIGVWAQAELPALPQGHSRLMMLTPGGPRFGQGPDGALRQDRPAATFFDLATQLMIAVVDAALDRPDESPLPGRSG